MEEIVLPGKTLRNLALPKSKWARRIGRGIRLMCSLFKMEIRPFAHDSAYWRTSTSCWPFAMRWSVSRTLGRSVHRRTSLKKSEKRSLHFVLFLTFLLSSALAFGQDSSQAGNKKPRGLDDYEPRTLKEIVARKPDPKDLRDKQDRLVVTADDLPSRVRVT